MGSAPPSGGAGAGNAPAPQPSGGLNAFNIQAAASPFDQQPGRVVVKVHSNGSPTPFSGMTDAGGYFFIPLIPEGEPFTAIAIDTLTGQFRTFEGIGPAVGQHVLMFFDFFKNDVPLSTIAWDGGGNGTSWHDPLNWDLDRLPILTDTVVIDVPGAITVTHSQGNTSILSLHSQEAMVLSGGSLSLNVASTISNTFTFSGGTLTSIGSLTVDGGLVLSGPSPKFLNGITLTNTGSATWTGTGFLYGSNGAVFNNLASGTFDIQNNTSFQHTGGASTIFNNAGLVRKSAGAGTTFFGGPVTFSGGNVEVLTGTLSLAGNNTTTTGGNFTVASGAVLDLTGNTGRVYVGSYTGSGAGTIRLGNGTLQIGAAGATFNFPGSLFQWSGGLLSGPAVLTNTGTLNLSGASIKTLSNLTLNNAGSVIGTGTGNLILNAGAVFNNQAGGAFDAQNDASIMHTFGAGPIFNNAGLVRKSAGVGTTTFGNNIAFANASTVTVQTGTLNFMSGYNQTAGTTNLNGGNLSGGTFNIQGGSLSGAGIITGTVTNGSQINPGGSGAAGLLTITGSYNQTATGALNIELGGLSAGQFDQVNVSGSATLTGTLTVSEINGFTPSSGQNFQVMNYGSRSGNFATISGPYTPTYNATNLTIQRQ